MFGQPHRALASTPLTAGRRTPQSVQAAVWGRFHDGGGGSERELSAGEREAIMMLDAQVTQLTREREELQQALSTSLNENEELSSEFEAAVEAAEAQVKSERGEHAAAVAALQEQYDAGVAEVARLRAALEREQRANSALEASSSSMLGDAEQRCAAAESAWAAAQAACANVSRERDRALQLEAAAIGEKEQAQAALRAALDSIHAREQNAEARLAEAEQLQREASAKWAEAAAAEARATAALVAAQHAVPALVPVQAPLPDDAADARIPNLGGRGATAAAANGVPVAEPAVSGPSNAPADSSRRSTRKRKPA